MQQAARAVWQISAGGYRNFFLCDWLENVGTYYVTAGAMTSKHFNIHVTDLPAVKQIRVTLSLPRLDRHAFRRRERSGDLRAVIGTEAELDVPPTMRFRTASFGSTTDKR